jgi:hypothetical protein
MSMEIRIDRLLGRQVLAANNRPIGRIEEFRVDERGGGWVVTSYLVGPGALLERLNLGARQLLGPIERQQYIVPSDQLDLANPDQPRLRCTVEDLARTNPA